jgi:hypothetical protein
MENNVMEEVTVEKIKENEKRMRQERMLLEYRDLVCKLTNLENFIGTDEFNKLEDEDRELLFRQHRSMFDYADTLVTRILREMK